MDGTSPLNSTREPAIDRQVEPADSTSRAVNSERPLGRNGQILRFIVFCTCAILALLAGNILASFMSWRADHQPFLAWEGVDSLDFGKVGFGRLATASIGLKNNSKTPLFVVDIKSTCPCVRSSLESQIIDPGESVEVLLKLLVNGPKITGLAKEGASFRQTAVLRFQLPDRGEALLELPITANIGPQVKTASSIVMIPLNNDGSVGEASFEVVRNLISESGFRGLHLSGPSYYRIKVGSRKTDSISWKISLKKSQSPRFLQPLQLHNIYGNDVGESVGIPVRYEKSEVWISPGAYFASIGEEEVSNVRGRSRFFRKRFTLAGHDYQELIITKVGFWTTENAGVTEFVKAEKDNERDDCFYVWLDRIPAAGWYFGRMIVDYKNSSGKQASIPFDVRVSANH